MDRHDPRRPCLLATCLFFSEGTTAQRWDVAYLATPVSYLCAQAAGTLPRTQWAAAAVRCHYCGSEDLSVSQVSCPLFSQAAVDGHCPRCKGSSFTVPNATGVLAAGGYALGGVAGAVVGAAIGAATADTIVVCVTCGARYRRG
jgi:Zn finger protein HypA/HybF involved in hydrogenase expression